MGHCSSAPQQVCIYECVCVGETLTMCQWSLVCVSSAFDSESLPPVTEGGVQREDDGVQNRCCLQSQPNRLNCTVCSLYMCVCRPYYFLSCAHACVCSHWDQSFQVIHTLMLRPCAFFSTEQKTDRGRQLDTSVTLNGCGDSWHSDRLR